MAVKASDGAYGLPGVGKKRAEALKKLGIETIEDFFYFFPRTYQDRRNISGIADAPADEAVYLRAQVIMLVPGFGRAGKKRTLRLLIQDDSGNLEVVFFNASYLEKSIKQGQSYDFYGKISEKNGKRTLVHPEISPSSGSESGILPIYPLSAGLTQRSMRKWQQQAQELIDSGQYRDYMPLSLLRENRLCSLEYAIKNIHFPEDGQKLKEARYRLVFDELFLMQLAIALVKQGIEEKKYIVFDKKVRMDEYISGLGFKLTEAQRRVAAAIESDMEAKRGMNRLVQGDVGSGKTVIAEAALYKAVKSGYQGAMMAPTEILAKQHFSGLAENLGKHGIRVALLVSGLRQSEKRKLLEELKNGDIDVLVGTNAIIQSGVEYKNLGLVITDEQHRFGVRQRMLLTDKGESPDVLVMTATPIPRTLAVVLYGELDISVIDELPAGRKEIKTRAFSEKDRKKAYESLAEEVEKGRQAYVVAPLIEESEESELRSAEGLYAELKKKYPKYRIALLHGELKQEEKNAVMLDFQAGKTDVLVSTVVIEVGINVPNASVMLIENAERFGLAQLHQLRGRVGRGEFQSYCFLITDSDNDIARQRAEIMCEESSGFEIAEKDLLLRGPGEFFGTRQHGLPELKIANLAKHGAILEKAQAAAKKLVESPAFGENAENREILEKINKNYDIVL